MNGVLVLKGGVIRTNNGKEMNHTALLIEDGIVTEVGSDAEIMRRAADALQEGRAEVRDLQGAVVTPGLFDSHTHPHWAVNLTAGLDLGGITTLEGLRAALNQEHKRLPPEAWLIGWNLEFEPFDGQEVHSELIEEAVEGRPSAIMFYDLHTGFGTKAALLAAGITGPRKFADRSEIKIGTDGKPTGELSEPSAYKLLFDAAPPRNRAEERDALRDMFDRFASVGLTGGAIMDGTPETISLISELEDRGELSIRVTVHEWHGVHDTDADIAARIARKDQRGTLWRADAIKLFSDGVIDTGTAYLHSPDTQGESTQSFWLDWGRYKEVVRKYHDAGMLIATHAVGDAAVSAVTRVYKSLPPKAAAGLPGHSIEHLEVLSDADIEELQNSGITASMQPLHMQWRSAENDDSWCERLGPERYGLGFRVRSILDAGVPMVLGSDWPVAQYDPRIGMAWARGRHTPGNPEATIFEPEERLTGEEALLAYTLWPAQARAETKHGKIAPGFVADLTIWSADPVTATPDELVEVPILMTVLGGRITHDCTPSSRKTSAP